MSTAVAETGFAPVPDGREVVIRTVGLTKA